MARAGETATRARGREGAGEEVVREVQALRADIAALAEALRAYGGAAVEEVRERSGAASEDALAESLRALRELRGQVDGVQARLEGDVRAHPLVWLAGAAGLGLLLGLLMGPRA